MAFVSHSRFASVLVFSATKFGEKDLRLPWQFKSMSMFCMFLLVLSMAIIWHLRCWFSRGLTDVTTSALLEKLTTSAFWEWVVQTHYSWVCMFKRWIFPLMLPNMGTAFKQIVRFHQTRSAESKRRPKWVVTIHSTVHKYIWMCRISHNIPNNHWDKSLFGIHDVAVYIYILYIMMSLYFLGLIRMANF